MSLICSGIYNITLNLKETKRHPASLAKLWHKLREEAAQVGKSPAHHLLLKRTLSFHPLSIGLTGSAGTAEKPGGCGTRELAGPGSGLSREPGWPHWVRGLQGHSREGCGVGSAVLRSPDQPCASRTEGETTGQSQVHCVTAVGERTAGEEAENTL